MHCLGMLLLVLVVSLLALVGHVSAATCVWAWDPITLYKNGTPAKLQGYRLYSSTMQSVYLDPPLEIPMSKIPDKNAPSYTVHCFAGQFWMVVGYSEGRTSDASGEVRVPQ